MALTVRQVGFGPSAFRALQRAVGDAQQGDRLAPVTVVVPTNTAGVMFRRALGRRGGIAGVNFLTIYRLGDLLVGGSLAAAGRRPVTTPIVGAAMTLAVGRTGGPLRSASPHRATIDALIRVHHELRELDPRAVDRLARAGSPLVRDVVGVHREALRLLSERWHDESDLLSAAAARCSPATLSAFGTIVVMLPQRLSAPAVSLLSVLARHAEVHIVVGRADDTTADLGADDLTDRLLGGPDAADGTERGGGDNSDEPGVGAGRPAAPTHVDVLSATDADDEVRAVCRRLLDAARSGVPFDRMAVLWTASDPYLRIIGEHLDTAGIPWNGTSPGRLTERVAARTLLRAIDLDRLGWRRADVFELLADASVLDGDRRPVPTAAWERVAREAGVRLGPDWDEALERYATRTSLPADPDNPDDERLAGLRVSRRGAHALALRSFILDLRDRLGDPAERRPWVAWVEWSHELTRRLLGGEAARRRLPVDEQRAFEALEAAVDRLRGLDEFLAPVDRQGFRDALAAELDSRPIRRGRIGHGVLVGPLSSGIALDGDLIAILGAIDGAFPARPQPDPLLGESDRRRAGIPPTPGELTVGDQRRALLATIASAPHVLIGVARGDLRRSAVRSPSRWIGDLHARADVHHVHLASHLEALASTEFPLHDQEYSGRALLRHVRAGGRVDDHPLALADRPLADGLHLVRSRESPVLTAFDGDLSGMPIPSPFGTDTPIAPTRLERWASCPHAYFMRHILHVDADDTDIDELAISPRQRGSLVHAALDGFLTDVLTSPGGAWPSGRPWSDKHRRRAHRALDEAADTAAKAGMVGHPTLWRDDLRRVHVVLDGWLDEDDGRRAAEGRELVGSETEFGSPGAVWPAAPVILPDCRRIAFRGAIDRVERRGDGTLVVTDHKTGRGTKFAKVGPQDPLARGRLYQLGAYAAAAATAYGMSPLGIRAEYALVERRTRREPPGFVVTDEVWAAFVDALAVIADGIEGGMFPPRPEPPVFRPFVACRYCDPDGMGTADGYRRWLHKRLDPRLAAYVRLVGEADDPDTDEGSGS